MCNTCLRFQPEGYNIIIGDPHSKGNDRDPGWQNDIIDRNFLKEEWVKDDSRCSYDSSNHIVTGAKSAQASRMSEWTVKTSAGITNVVSAAFTASHSVREMNRRSLESMETFFETRAACHLKTAELPAPFIKYEFTADFRNAVKDIPTDASKSSAEAVQWVIEHLLVNYGTHYTAKISSGGLMGIRSWMDDSSFRWLQETSKQEGFSVDAAANGWFGLYFDYSSKMSSKHGVAHFFEEARESGGYASFCIGCDAFVRNDAEKWAEQVKENLAPIGSKTNELVPISDLLVPLHFPEMDAEELRKKKSTVELALEKLCGYYAQQGCSTQPSDRAEPGARMIRVGSVIHTVKWSPDGTTLASGDEEYLVRLWDVASGQSLRILRGHTGWVHGVAFSPDGGLIASASVDKTVKIWNTTSGECLQTLEGHTDVVESVAFSPDGRHIVSGSCDHTLKIWETATGNFLRTLPGHTKWVNSVAFSSRSTIASASDDTTVKIWDPATGNCLHTLKGHTDVVFSVAFSPDGRTIVSGSRDKSVIVWEAATGNLLQTLTGHDHWVAAVAFGPRGTIASASDDETVKIWDAATGNCLQTLTGHTDWVWAVDFSPDGLYIVSGSHDTHIRIWDALVPPQRRMVLYG
ncbi:Vegetative incompatibility protein HET-E-1 [Durusdinium trenchii]